MTEETALCYDGATAKETEMKSYHCITELYNKTYQNVYLTVRGMIRDEDTVLDICQDTYVKAFQSLEQLDNADSFLPWVKTIARNKAIDYLRKNKPVLFSELENEDGRMQEFVDEREDHLPEAVIDGQETERLLKEMLDSLPEDQRACISMFYYEDMPIKQIAAVLGVSENTVKSRLNYGKKKIKANVEALEKKGVKLYGLGASPMLLLLLLFRSQGGPSAAAQLAQLGKVKLALESVAKVAAEATTQQAGQTIAKAGRAAKTGAQTIAKTGRAAQMSAQALAKGAAVTAGKAAAVKVAAVIAAVAVVGGGVGAGVHANRQRQLAAEQAVAEENVPEEVAEVEESTEPGETQMAIDPEVEETPTATDPEIEEIKIASAEDVLALLPKGEYISEDGVYVAVVEEREGTARMLVGVADQPEPRISLRYELNHCVIEEKTIYQNADILTVHEDGSFRLEADHHEKWLVHTFFPTN